MNTSTDSTRTPSESTARPTPGTVEQLATAACWELIEARSFGRLAVEGLDGIPDVFPLNYTVHDGSLYIRSAAGSKLMAIAVHPVAAFEIDGEDDGFHWSVVLRGAARRLAIDKEIRESGVRALASSSPTGKHHYICVTPSSVSGRRFAAKPTPDTSATRDPEIRTSPESAHEPTQSDEASLVMPDPDSLRMERPVPIAHFSPR